MKKQLASGLLVLIPHSSIKRPKEIRSAALSVHQEKLLVGGSSETDRGTSMLYDFRSILGNKQLVFPISQIYLNIVRSPNNLAQSVPLEIRGIPVYKEGKELALNLRKDLINKYHLPFYDRIKEIKPKLIFNGHSTFLGHGSLKNKKLDCDIFLVESSHEYKGKNRDVYNKVSRFYLQELRKRLPELKISVSNTYSDVYDHIFTATKRRIPVLTQEVSEDIYIRNNKIMVGKLDKLRQAFAESLLATVKHFKYNL